MRVIDRLATFLAYKKITPYSFELTVGVANGYLKKQLKGKGSIGSDILQRIYRVYADLDFIWLLTGNGDMLCDDLRPCLVAYSKDEIIQMLNERIELLEASLTDKKKIILLFEKRLEGSIEQKTN